MRGLFDFSSWQGLLSTLLGLVLVTVMGVGIRLVLMQRVQQRRERQNRQINERLKTLIAAYRTLGGSFTGNLAVDPSHLRDVRTRAAVEPEHSPGETTPEWSGGSERSRRIRDAVEAALSDVVLLGTAEQVRLAAQAASDMVAGRKIETARLVRSLRDFIREVLDLETVPLDLEIPGQGPSRSSAAGGRGNAARTGGRAGGGGGQGGAGMAAGGMLGLGAGRPPQDADSLPDPDARQP